MFYKYNVINLSYGGNFPGDPMHCYGSQILLWSGESQIPKCTTPFKWCQYLPLEKWLPMSTTILGLPFLPNLDTDQIQIKLTDEQIVNLQCSALWVSHCPPCPKRILHHIHAWLPSTLCLQKLIHVKLFSNSLSLSCQKTKCTLNSDLNALGVEKLEKGTSTPEQKAETRGKY